MLAKSFKESLGWKSLFLFAVLLRLVICSSCLGCPVFCRAWLLSDRPPFDNVDEMVTNVGCTVEFANSGVEELGITQHPAKIISNCPDICGRGACLPFFSSYRLDVHLGESLGPLLAVAAEYRVHNHLHGHLW